MVLNWTYIYGDAPRGPRESTAIYFLEGRNNCGYEENGNWNGKHLKAISYKSHLFMLIYLFLIFIFTFFYIFLYFMILCKREDKIWCLQIYI